MKPLTLLKSRFGGLYILSIIFLAVSFALRTALCIRSAADADFTFPLLTKIYAVGLLFDFVTCFYCAVPVFLYLLFIPDKTFNTKANRRFLTGLYLALLCAIIFDVFAEWLFWGEFYGRFNFVAIDYLTYPRQIVRNIIESYPVAPLFAVLFAATAAIFFATRKYYFLTSESVSSFRQRLKSNLPYFIIPLLSPFFIDISLADVSRNHYADELAKNGVYTFFAAFRNNVLDYEKSYITQDSTAALTRLKELLKTDNSKFVDDNEFDITRDIVCQSPEKRCNVIILIVESLSAEYLGVFGNKDGLTPNLDTLASESVFFTDFYAAGTRTIRALEAITLSLPPTPGRSLVKRPGNGHLFSIGPLFTRRGYETKFICGGRSYFDNMDHFFEEKNFEDVNQLDFNPNEITFTNAWGVCDEDLFAKTLKEGDKSFAAGRPFCFLMLTTSNHRPYTYPQKIDIPSGSGRKGAVKYTDYAIGNFLRSAKAKPWFDNTIFVIVADHGATAVGKVEMPVEKYHIPLFIYAPALIKPQKIDTLAGQIDLAPTLLGLLNFSYRTKFFGRDVLQPGRNRVLLGDCEEIGLFSGDKLLVLLPQKVSRIYRVDADGNQTQISEDKEFLSDAVSFYQSASYLVKNHLYNYDFSYAAAP
jgi:phosphoglycerol transferase MdoB-like AlkP superfamily enzyme